MPHDALPPGTQLNQFRILSVLGQGGFGVTYQAEDTDLGRRVALKEFYPAGLAFRAGGLVQARGDDGSYQAGLARFVDEARTLARFNHPNIVRVLNFFPLNGTAYLAMDFEAGADFSRVLQRLGAQPAQAALLATILPLLDGLAVVHAAGMVHRDIKPANIIIRADGAPVLIDFGAARMAVGQRSLTLSAIVSPGFGPPEQYAERGQQGPWTDIYALGATLWRAISGRKPPDAMDRMLDPTAMPAAAMIGQGRYDPGFLAAIDWALMTDHRARPQSVAVWRRALTGDESQAAAARKVGAGLMAPIAAAAAAALARPAAAAAPGGTGPAAGPAAQTGPAAGPAAAPSRPVDPAAAGGITEPSASRSAGRSAPARGAAATASLPRPPRAGVGARWGRRAALAAAMVLPLAAAAALTPAMVERLSAPALTPGAALAVGAPALPEESDMERFHRLNTQRAQARLAVMLAPDDAKRAEVAAAAFGPLAEQLGRDIPGMHEDDALREEVRGMLAAARAWPAHLAELEAGVAELRRVLPILDPPEAFGRANDITGKLVWNRGDSWDNPLGHADNALVGALDELREDAAAAKNYASYRTGRGLELVVAPGRDADPWDPRLWTAETKTFQRRNGMAPTGRLDEDARRLLREQALAVMDERVATLEDELRATQLHEEGARLDAERALAAIAAGQHHGDLYAPADRLGQAQHAVHKRRMALQKAEAERERIARWKPGTEKH